MRLRLPKTAPSGALAGLLLASLAAAAAPAERVARGIDPEIPLAELQLVHWSRADGLPTDTLLAVRHTSRHYLWVAGFGGLARFDGVGFESFHQKAVPELRASSFYELVERRGILWLATQGSGIWKLEDDRFSPVAPDQVRGSVRGLYFDRSGTLWAGLADHGAVRLEDGRAIPVDYPALAGTTVRDILQTPDGALWFATEGRGLARLAEGEFHTLTTSLGREVVSINILCLAGDGGFWIGTQSGLRRYRDGEVSRVEELEGFEIFALVEDDYGSLWVAAEQGLFRRNGRTGRVERLAEHQGHSLRSINGVAFDHEGGVWISSYTSGLFQLLEGKFVNWTRADGLRTERINSLYERRDGAILVGGDQGAVHLIHDGEVSAFELRDPLPEVRVRGFLEDSRGALWISSYAGLLRIDEGGERLYTTADGLPTNQIRFVYEDSRRRLWAGTRGGGLVAIAPGGSFGELDTAAGLASGFVLAMAEHPSGDLLVGTQSGLSVLGAGGEVTNITSREGLPADLVFNIQIDGDGAAWIATTRGLARLLDGKIDAVGVPQGLPAEAVYDYAEDGAGNVWLTSSEGVIRIDKSQLEAVIAGRRATVVAKLFDETDGMANQQCTGATSMLRARDGSLWIPTLGGISRIDPRRISRNPMPPPVEIRRFRVDGEPLARGSLEGGGAEVGPGAKKFEFTFAALTYQAPSRVDVRYRLEGFDGDWIPAGRERSVVYTSLPPGDFVFRVIAANRDGVWNRDGASLRFRIRPRFHQTPLFFALLTLTLVAAPWTVYRWRLHAVHRRAELERLLSEQRRLEAERTRLIAELESRNDQLEDLTRAVSHDLRSPLFTIQGFVGALENDLSSQDASQTEKDLARIREATSYMASLLEQLTRVRRLERAETSIEEIDLGEVAEEAVAAVAGLIAQGGIEAEISPDMPRVVGDRVQLTEMLQNLVENAARFMGERPEPRIEVGWRRDGDEPVFFVRDNGIGIDPRFHDRVFGLFERLSPDQNGTGVGLSIVKRIVEAHGGRVWIESAGDGGGSVFCFTLRARTAAPWSREPGERP